MKKIQVLGSGCSKCRVLAERAEEAARALGLDYTLEKVTDIEQIAAAGVLATPVLMVDGLIVVSGRVPSTDAIREMLS